MTAVGIARMGDTQRIGWRNAIAMGTQARVADRPKPGYPGPIVTLAEVLVVC